MVLSILRHGSVNLDSRIFPAMARLWREGRISGLRARFLSFPMAVLRAPEP
jgi:hypothetical protein